MKKLVMINGSMGVGKSTTCEHLSRLLSPSIYLDGDWCWQMNPFQVTEDTKVLVMKNIHQILHNDLCCPAFDYVIFCWVMHHEEIVSQVLSGLTDIPFTSYLFTLTCTPEALAERLNKDIANGKREGAILSRSLKRLPLYEKMHSVKIDVSSLSAQEAALSIKHCLTQT